MTRSEFNDLLRKATAASVNFARRYVENDLPEAVRFRVLLNQSADNPAETAVRMYPEDVGREFSGLSEEEVCNLLLRDGRCPQWVDVSVEAQSPTDTRVCLRCCGRFTDDTQRMYYSGGGMGPFGIKSPGLPLDFKEGTKFRVPMV